MARSIKEIQADIAEIKAGIDDPKSTATEVSDYKGILSGLEQELVDAMAKGEGGSSAEPKHKEAGGKKVKGKAKGAVAKKKKAKEEKPAKPAKQKAGKKAKVKKVKEEKPAGKYVIDRVSRTVTIAGEKFSVDKCDEAMTAWDAEMERRKKSGKKFARKSNAEVVGDKLVSVGEKVINSIKKTDVDNKPAYYTSRLAKLSSLMKTIADLVDELLDSDDASKEMKDLVKAIEAYIKKIKK